MRQYSPPVLTLKLRFECRKRVARSNCFEAGGAMLDGGKSESYIARERYPELPSRALKETDLGAVDLGRGPLLLGVRTEKDPVAMPEAGCDCHAFLRGE